METIKTSWNRLMEASRVAETYLREHPEKTKVEYAIQRTLPRIARTNDDLQEQLDAIGADHAVTGSVGGVDGVILRNAQGGYQFTPEKQKACSVARRALLNKADGVEVEVHFATELPRDKKTNKLLLDIAYLEAFDGVFIRHEDVIAAYAEIEDQIESTVEPSTAKQPTVQ